jgi:hypothetical protein
VKNNFRNRVIFENIFTLDEQVSSINRLCTSTFITPKQWYGIIVLVL